MARGNQRLGRSLFLIVASILIITIIVNVIGLIADIGSLFSRPAMRIQGGRVVYGAELPELLLIETAPDRWTPAGNPFDVSYSLEEIANMVRPDTKLRFEVDGQYFEMQASGLSSFFTGISRIIINHSKQVYRQKLIEEKKQERLSKEQARQQVEDFRNDLQEMMRNKKLDAEYLLRVVEYEEIIKRSETPADIQKIIDHITKYGIEVYGDNLSHKHMTIIHNLEEIIRKHPPKGVESIAGFSSLSLGSMLLLVVSSLRLLVLRR